MGIANITRSLRLTAKLLKKTNTTLVSLERSLHPVTKPSPPTDPTTSLRSALTAATSDLAIALISARHYIAILYGVPMTLNGWSLRDAYTSRIEDEGYDDVLSDFMRVTSGSTGLEWYLDFNDIQSNATIAAGASEEDETIVRAKEIFETYRAMGCVGFNEFEIGVHRAVWRAEEMAFAVAEEVEELMGEMGRLRARLGVRGMGRR